MDWKTTYTRELAQVGSRDRVVEWLGRPSDDRIAGAIDRGAVLSFPHTALDFAGPLQAAVVAGLYRAHVDRVLALGVLHSGGLPAYRRALDPGEPLDVRERSFSEVSGAFADCSTWIETPFGRHPLCPASGTAVRDDGAEHLVGEFSLDTFTAVLRLGADVFDRAPIPMTAVLVGMTRRPATGSFETARRLAAWIRRTVDSRTAVVTTGDLVHYGAAYGSVGDVGNSVDPPALERSLRVRVEEMLSRAMTGEDETAYRLSLDELRNDQRELLPVVASYLEARASFELLEFSLSDYARLLSTPPPCFVASALVAYG